PAVVAGRSRPARVRRGGHGPRLAHHLEAGHHMTKTVEQVIDAAPAERQDALRRFDALIRAAAPELDVRERDYAGDLIGYGTISYVRSSDEKTVEWFVVGLANRKQYISLYSVAVDDGGYIAEQRAAEEFAGSKSGRSCINIRKPELID